MLNESGCLVVLFANIPVCPDRLSKAAAEKPKSRFYRYKPKFHAILP
jgi:hypothetical protein